MAGRKKSGVKLEQFAVTLPEGIYRQMIELIERDRRWDGRVEFTREAIREKLARESEISAQAKGPKRPEALSVRLGGV